MKTLKAVWTWLKGHVVAVLLALVGILSLRWLWSWKSSEAGKLKDKLVVSEALSKVAELRGRREELAKQSETKAETIKALDAEILESKKAIVAAHKEVEGLDAAGILKAFDELGYK